MKKLFNLIAILLCSCTGPVYTDVTAPKKEEVPVCLTQGGHEPVCETNDDCCVGFVCVKEDQSARSKKSCVYDK